MIKNRFFTSLLLVGLLPPITALANEPKFFYNYSSIGSSYKEQLKSAASWESRLTSMETNILARNRIDSSTKRDIEEMKKMLSEFNSIYGQLKKSSDYDLGRMVLKETVFSNDCVKRSHRIPVSSMLIFECEDDTRKRETFFSKIRGEDFYVESYRSGYIEDRVKDVELFVNQLRRYDVRAVNIGSIVHKN